MFRFVFFILLALCFADDSCDISYNDTEMSYNAVQINATLTAMADNPYLKLINPEGSYPTGIEYLQDINEDTDLIVRVVFGDENGILEPEYIKTICQILETDSTFPSSDENQLNVASSLALSGLKCPIQKGERSLTPYIFPMEFTMNDIGCGEKYYEMRLETANQTLDDDALMTLKSEILLTKNNETFLESSSDISSLPSITAIVIVALIVINFAG